MDVFQRNCLRIVSIQLSRATMRKTLRWLGHVLRSKDDRLPKIVLFGQPSRTKWKAGCPRLGLKNVMKKDLGEIGTSWEDVKREALNGLGWRWIVRSCVGLKWLGAALHSF